PTASPREPASLRAWSVRRRHHDGRDAQLALDVLAEAVGGVLVAKGADANAVPGAARAEIGLLHVSLETGAAGPAFEAGGVDFLLRGAELHGVGAEVARRRSQGDGRGGGDFEPARLRGRDDGGRFG